MTARKAPSGSEVRAAVEAITPWLDGITELAPARSELAAAVRLTVATVAAQAPGHAVELRVPPFAAVQCIAGPRHTRGTPANVVEVDSRTWLELATGRLHWAEAVSSGRLAASGTRAEEIRRHLPVVSTAARTVHFNRPCDTSTADETPPSP